MHQLYSDEQGPNSTKSELFYELMYQFHIVFGFCRAYSEPKAELQKSVCLFNLKSILKIISIICVDF